MKLKDIPDMERFLAEDCYCPGEIYSLDGFFYTIFSGEDECILVDEFNEKIAVISKLDSEEPQAVIFWRDDPERPGQIVAAQRVDATENNIELLKLYIHGEEYPEGRGFDEFEPGQTKKSLEKVFSLCDAIMVS